MNNNCTTDYENKEMIEKQLDKLIGEGKRTLIICPYGDLGRYACQILKNKYNIEPYAIVDNFSKEEGVWNVDEFKLQDIPENSYVIICSVFPEIQDGFKRILATHIAEDHICNILDKSGVDYADTSAYAKAELAQRLESGHVIIKNITRDKNKLYFLFSYQNGDIIAAASLMESAKRVYGYGQGVFVCLRRHRDIAKMFDAFDEVIEVSTTEMNDIRCVGSQFGYMWGENYILGNKKHLHRCFMIYDNFLDTFKLAIMQIPEKCKPSKLSDKIFTKSKEELKKIYGRSVLIAPYANSFANFPVEFWELIIRELKIKGYNVLCNLFGEEKELPGTVRLEKGLAETLEISYGCAGIISNRSGFSDLIAFNYDVPHVVIYPSEKMASFWDISIYGSDKTYKAVWNESYSELAERVLNLLALS